MVIKLWPGKIYIFWLNCTKEDTTIDNLVGKNLSVAGDTAAVLSDLSGDTFYNNSNNETETSNSSNIGSWKKGPTVRGKAADEKKRDDVLAQCALLYHQEREKARKNGTNVPDGLLKRLVLEEEEKAGLASNSMFRYNQKQS
jgi:hypothetical protein